MWFVPSGLGSVFLADIKVSLIISLTRRCADILVNMLKNEKKKAANAIQQLNSLGLGTPGGQQMALQSSGSSRNHQVGTPNGRHSLSAGDRANGAGEDVRNSYVANERLEATKTNICKFIVYYLLSCYRNM